MPKPTATGTSVDARTRSTVSASPSRQRVALAGGPRERHGVDEPARLRADGGDPLRRGRGRHERHQRQTLGVARRPQLARLVEGQVGNDQPGGARGGRPQREGLRTGGQHDVGVDHQDDRHPRREPLAHAEHPVRSGARGQRGRARGMDHRPVGERIGERDPELEQIGPGVGRGEPGGDRFLEARKATHQVRHESGALPVRAEGLGDAHASDSTSARSLSPRPDSVTRLSPGPGFARSQAIACDDSSAGRIPSSSATRWNAASAAPSSTAS